MMRFAVVSLDGTPAWRERPDAIVVSPFDTHLYFLKMPPVPAKKAAGAIRYKLRALHPGDPASAHIEYLGNGREANSFAAYVTDIDAAGRYRSYDAPCVAALAILALKKPRTTGRNLGFFFSPEWIEGFIFDSDLAVASEAVTVSNGVETALRALTVSLLMDARLDGVLVRAAFIAGNGVDAEGIRAALNSVGLRDIDLYDTGAMDARSFRTLPRLFRASVEHKRSVVSALLPLLVLNVVAGIYAVNEVAHKREAELDSLKKHYLALKAGQIASEKLGRDLLALEAEYASRAGQKSIDAYRFVSDIARSLGEGARIRSLTIRVDSFTVEAGGVDALGVLERFERSERFASVKLHHAIPSEKGGEDFTISGVFLHDR